MSPARLHHPAPRRVQRVLAWALAGMVFALGLLAVSPQTHAHLHDHNGEDHHHGPSVVHDDYGCAVTLFQQGVTTPLELPTLDTPRVTYIATLPLAPKTSVLSAPRHLLQPARGPPGRG